jgi:hypothetical protein
MGVTLVPDRQLATTAGVDEEGNFITLYRTEWVLRGQLVDATPWARSPRQAIGDGVDADEGYQQVLVHCA